MFDWMTNQNNRSWYFKEFISILTFLTCWVFTEDLSLPVLSLNAWYYNSDHVFITVGDQKPQINPLYITIWLYRSTFTWNVTFYFIKSRIFTQAQQKSIHGLFYNVTENSFMIQFRRASYYQTMKVNLRCLVLVGNWSIIHRKLMKSQPEVSLILWLIPHLAALMFFALKWALSFQSINSTLTCYILNQGNAMLNGIWMWKLVII